MFLLHVEYVFVVMFSSAFHAKTDKMQHFKTKSLTSVHSHKFKKVSASQENEKNLAQE